MFYPAWWLPEDQHAAVERAINAAELTLRESVRSGSKQYGPSLAFGYIDDVFVAFASQACEAARRGHLTPRKVRAYVERFLPLLFSEAFSLAQGRTVWHDDEFEQRADERLKASELWADHLREREEVASRTHPSAAHPVLGQLPRRLSMLLKVYKEMPANLSQKEIAGLIQEKLRVSVRDAQAYASLIRSDEAVSQDKRATRWRK